MARSSLALALAWAGGLASVGTSGTWTSLVVMLVAGMAISWLGPVRRDVSEGPALHRGFALAGLAGILGLLIHALVGLLVAVVPAAIALLGAGLVALTLAWLAAGGRRIHPGLSASFIGLGAVFAAVLGVHIESAGVDAQGRARGGPLLGVHPGQAIAVRIDGHGPHDLIAPDYVEAEGGPGLDAEAWATWASTQLESIGREHYARGPARARAAFAHARVEVTPDDEGRRALTITSGTQGLGSSVEVVCPSRSFDPRPTRASPSRAACPTKYQADGTTGLGLSRRWPGYIELPGRARPPLGPGLALACLGLGIVGWILVDRRLPRSEHPALAPLLLVVAASGLALALAVAWPAPRSNTTLAGPGLLALVLLGSRSSADPRPRRGREPLPPPLELGLIVGLALLLASPLAGASSASLRDGLVERMVLGLGMSWATGLTLATLVTALVLAIGIGICATALVPPATREPQHTPLSRLVLPLSAVALALLGSALGSAWLRKDGDFVALLTSAAALHLAATLSGPTRLERGLSATICASGPVVVLVQADLSHPAASIALVSALVCLGLGVLRPPLPPLPPTPAGRPVDSPDLGS